MTTTNTPTEVAQADLELIRAAVGSGARPNTPSALSASITHGWRAMLKIRHVPEQLFDVTAFPVMMTLMFTYLFGGALAGSTGEYLQFFLPGILVQSILFITMYSGVGLNIDAEKGVFDRFRSLPMWRPSAIIGPLLGDVARYSIASVVILGLGFALGFRPDGNILGVIAAVALILLFAFSVSWIWTMFGLKLRSEKSVMSTSMMILFPLTFVSNVFVDPSTMPSVLQAIVEYNPVTWLTSATRDLMHGTGETVNVVKALGACVALVAIFAPLTMRFYKNKS
jgi:ABC-2 type transport system permease protein